MYEAINLISFRTDVTILDKSKAERHLTASEERYYQYAWFYPFKPLIWRGVIQHGDALVVVVASLGTRKRRQLFRDAVDDVINQCYPSGIARRVVALNDESDYGLQAADYAVWAVMRKWEQGDPRSYNMINGSVASEYDLFRTGKKHYY